VGFIFLFGDAARAEVRATYIGHASVLLEAGESRLLTDPCWREKILGGVRRRIPPAMPVEDLPAITLVVVSHTHPDHYDPDAISRLPGHPTIVMPWGRGRELRKKGMTVVEMKPGEEKDVAEFRLKAHRARHMWGHCLSYLIEIEGKKVYFPGDIGSLKGLAEIGKENVDLMLTIYGGTPVIGSIWTTDQAVEAVRLVSPRAVIPIHWGTFARWWTKEQPESPEAFLARLREDSPEVHGILLRAGDRTSLEEYAR
jgi:L-ascorbate metabolism protein UlaG (beta-lactamase superfamily)